MATSTGRPGGGQKRGRENASTARHGAKRAKLLASSGPTLEQEAESIATARMAIGAFLKDWEKGVNRKVDWEHVGRLSKRFVDHGGPDLVNPKHYISVLAEGEDITRMLGTISTESNPNASRDTLLDFLDWMKVNEGRQVEVLSGQHRLEALKDYGRLRGLAEGELWWPCVIYDRSRLYKWRRHPRAPPTRS